MRVQLARDNHQNGGCALRTAWTHGLDRRRDLRGELGLVPLPRYRGNSMTVVDPHHLPRHTCTEAAAYITPSFNRWA